MLTPTRKIFPTLPAITALLLCLTTGCSRPADAPGTVQGYVEGEFVYIAPPLSGRLDKLLVRRGTVVKQGDPLFELENVTEKAARDETKLRITQLRAQVNDARKGKRPTEVEASTAQLNQARSALQLSEKELARLERLASAQVVPLQDLDRMRSRHDQDRQRVLQLEAELGTARLGLRSDQISATEASERVLEATLTRNEWDLGQKRQSAPTGGLIFDTLFQPGEWIAAGRPAIVLLPPRNIKVRAFAPQAVVAKIRIGDTVPVTVDGTPAPCRGTVSYISPQAEYTPPVIYNRDNRQKLVYLVEVSFDPSIGTGLHPGQPVDVRFGSGP